MPLNQSGRCLCGDISYQFNSSNVLSAHHCHCTDCQKSNGSGKATIIYISKRNIITSGKPKYFEQRGSIGLRVRRGFCRNCGSGILSYIRELPMLIFVKAGTLEDSSWLEIESNFFVRSAKQWDLPDKSIKCFRKNPSLFSNIKTIYRSITGR
ncbi:MAG: aldehyde-activating protein [Gammaproteobacteria bacterium]|nr:aldehyde-activating protein [Gammaproteobacteria bacterium]